MSHTEAMETINSLIGRAWVFVVAAVVFLVVVNDSKHWPRSVRGAVAANVVAVREAVDTVADRSARWMVWFALALVVPYSVLVTLNTMGVWVVLAASFVVAVVSMLAPLVVKIWRKRCHRNGDHGAVPVSASKAEVVAVVAGDTIKAVRADVTALSQEMVLLRDSVVGERDEARQELAELQVKVQALPEQVRDEHDLH